MVWIRAKLFIKRLLPGAVIELVRKCYVIRMRHRNARLTTKRVFEEVYKNRLWGGHTGAYCSGSGSDAPHAIAYAGLVQDFIVTNGIETVVDLGCGDFRIGQCIQRRGLQYIGVDIVRGLVQYNRSKYGSSHTSFLCLDIIEDPLPDAELCLLRQVLQHLSNSQIASVLTKISKYRYVFVTEHYPDPNAKCIPNRDKPHGSDTRLIDNSAVFLTEPPFNLPVEMVRLVLEEPFIDAPGQILKTFLIENNTEKC